MTFSNTVRRAFRVFLSATLLLVLFTHAAVAAPNKAKKARYSGIPGEYIVALSDSIEPNDVERIAKTMAKKYGVTVQEIWSETLRGFLVNGSPEAADAIANDSSVRYVEQNLPLKAEVSGDCKDIPSGSSTRCTWIGENYLWHLDRIDELSWADRDGKYNLCTNGSTVRAYVLDTGVNGNHSEFAPNRVVAQLDFSEEQGPNNSDVTNGCENTTSLTSHGTTVASVIGGNSVGVAQPEIVSLKAYRCSDQLATTARLITAVEWIANNNAGRRAVVNHSGFIPPWGEFDEPGSFAAYGDAVNNFVLSTRIPFFTSANNFSADACSFSPAHRAYTMNRQGSVFVVGGTNVSEIDSNDHRYQLYAPDGLPALGYNSGSNSGDCISAWAPAVSIYSAAGGNGYAYAPPGTSFASPIAAGLAARFMAKQANDLGITAIHTDVYEFLLRRNQARIQPTDAQTTAYYFCRGTSLASDSAWFEGDQPANCPPNTLGQSGGQTAPYYFPSVGNSSNAAMLHWDESSGAYCPQ